MSSQPTKPEEVKEKRDLLRAGYILEDTCEDLINDFFEQRKAIIRLQVQSTVLEQDADEVLFDLEEIRRKLIEQEHKINGLEKRIRHKLSLG